MSAQLPYTYDRNGTSFYTVVYSSTEKKEKQEINILVAKKRAYGKFFSGVLLKQQQKIYNNGGQYVFPGGAISKIDNYKEKKRLTNASSKECLAEASRNCLLEFWEETGLDIQLVLKQVFSGMEVKAQVIKTNIDVNAKCDFAIMFVELSHACLNTLTECINVNLKINETTHMTRKFGTHDDELESCKIMTLQEAYDVFDKQGKWSSWFKDALVLLNKK